MSERTVLAGNAVHTARANSGEIIDVMVPPVTEETLEQFVDVPVPQS